MNYFVSYKYNHIEGMEMDIDNILVDIDKIEGFDDIIEMEKKIAKKTERTNVRIINYKAI